ncbi:hypothetical protein CHS0354_017803 [Potamilus streckersoni]|uniref:Uncharacterized protein n=1 Tax=Potamilus streckersoni TaxID=2493646 RepID=A0AAE0T8T7_9BIVA|nr:hypothetical protein CHS0354_017803 [Potamilus streckersoni]
MDTVYSTQGEMGTLYIAHRENGDTVYSTQREMGTLCIAHREKWGHYIAHREKWGHYCAANGSKKKNPHKKIDSGKAQLMKQKSYTRTLENQAIIGEISDNGSSDDDTDIEIEQNQNHEGIENEENQIPCYFRTLEKTQRIEKTLVQLEFSYE